MIRVVECTQPESTLLFVEFEVILSIIVANSLCSGKHVFRICISWHLYWLEVEVNRERERGSIYLQIGQQQSAVRTNHNIFNGKSVENFRRRTLKFNDVGQELWVPLHFPATQINFDGMQCASCRLAHTFYCVCKAKIYYYYLSSFQLAYKSVISIFLLLLPSYDANQLWNCIAIPFWHYEKWCRIAKKKKQKNNSMEQLYSVHTYSNRFIKIRPVNIFFSVFLLVIIVIDCSTGSRSCGRWTGTKIDHFPFASR